jgi:hypothetical protein
MQLLPPGGTWGQNTTQYYNCPQEISSIPETGNNVLLREGTSLYSSSIDVEHTYFAFIEPTLNATSFMK